MPPPASAPHCTTSTSRPPRSPGLASSPARLAPPSPRNNPDRVSLRSIGVFTNPLLLGGIAAELVLAAALIYLPFLHHVFGTAALSPTQLAVVVPYPFVIWGADEVRRWVQRHRAVPLQVRN